MIKHLAARTAPLAAIALVGIALASCGGDDDDGADGGGAADDAQVAKSVEDYVRENTKDVSGVDAKPGEVISAVQFTDGQVKVLTFLNGDRKPDDKPAAEICRAVKASGVSEVESAVVVDAGDVELARC